MGKTALSTGVNWTLKNLNGLSGGKGTSSREELFKTDYLWFNRRRTKRIMNDNLGYPHSCIYLRCVVATLWSLLSTLFFSFVKEHHEACQANVARMLKVETIKTTDKGIAVALCT